MSVPGDRDPERPSANGFTLIELLIVIAILSVLMSVLLPSLGAARAQARAVACGSNIRQLALANSGYAFEHRGRYCPGAARMKTENLHRWHGTRAGEDEPFDPRHGPLEPYLGTDQAIRACPSFDDFVRSGPAAFELGNGGYGYNQAYVGRVLRKREQGSWEVITDHYGILSERVRRPSATLMFADTALAAPAEGVVEYSFAEPRFHPEYLVFAARADPSIHFRHRGRANVAWCDGHVDPRELTFTWRSGVYLGDPGRHDIGWFGLDDNNGYFDPD